MKTKPQIVKRRLLHSHDFYINCCNDNGRAFVDIFRQTWRCIPLCHRRDMLRYWKNGTVPGPFFELSNFKDVYGQVETLGFRIYFRQSFFANAPTGASRFVIAHELAHVYQWANNPAIFENEESELEEDADRIAINWGFERYPLSFLVYEKNKHNISFEEACARLKERPEFS